MKIDYSGRPLALVLLVSLYCVCRVSHAGEGMPDIKLVTKEHSIGTAEIRAIPSTIKISPDGKHMAFVAHSDNGLLVVADGILGEVFDSIGDSSLIFSPDSKRLAYAALRGNNWILVVDGVNGAECDSLRNVVFSPDSRRVAYAAKRGNDWSVVVDGTEGKNFDDCCEIVFSPDSRRVAYAANRGRKWSVIVDGTEGKEHDFSSGIAFSPDSKRLAYIAKHGNNWLVVVDGSEGNEYDAVGRGGFRNPEVIRAAYTTLKLEPQGAAPDDIIGESGPVFSPDSKRIAYWALRGNRWFVSVDGLETKAYDGFIRGSNLVFDSNVSLHAIAVLGNDALRVDVNIVENK